VGQPARNNVAWRRICPGPLAIFLQRPMHARVMKLIARSHHCRRQTIATAPPGLAPPTASPLPMCSATHPYLLPYQSRGQVGEKFFSPYLSAPHSTPGCHRAIVPRRSIARQSPLPCVVTEGGVFSDQSPLS
jgi:hypothetical protein